MLKIIFKVFSIFTFFFTLIFTFSIGEIFYNSIDGTEEIMRKFSKRHSFIRYVNRVSSANHQPGSKVIRAFEQGLDALTVPYNVLVKLDADLLLPPNYFSILLELFKEERVGIAGGFCVEQNKQGQWELNHPMGKDHVRGAFKAYHSDCFVAIGGLRPYMGWDTVDELLARFHGFTVRTQEACPPREGAE